MITKIRSSIVSFSRLELTELAALAVMATAVVIFLTGN
jgi:hypothetical protein